MKEFVNRYKGRTFRLYHTQNVNLGPYDLINPKLGHHATWREARTSCDFVHLFDAYPMGDGVWLLDVQPDDDGKPYPKHEFHQTNEVQIELFEEDGED